MQASMPTNEKRKIGCHHFAPGRRFPSPLSSSLCKKMELGSCRNDLVSAIDDRSGLLMDDRECLNDLEMFL